MNAINFNDKNFQTTTVAVMNDILTSDENGNSMEDLYKIACKYVNMTKGEFMEKYAEAKEKIAFWTETNAFENSNCELSDEELDMVAGGSFGSFMGAIWDGIKTGACAVGNFVKENAASIGIVVACVAMGAASGGFFGIMGAGFVKILCTAASVSAVYTGCAVGGVTIGGVAGLAYGIWDEYIR